MNEVMNAVMRCIFERRAIRKYKPDQIPKEALDEILEAGLYAPSAGGRQSVLFVVSQNKEINEALGRINRSAMPARPGAFVSKEQPSIIDDLTIESAFYGAPTVITLFSMKNGYGASDCSTAAENMMLAAHSLGIGSCLIGRAGEAFESDFGKELIGKLQIDNDYVPYFHVILGYTNGEYPHVKPRKENRIMYIE
jgi:nitroreductase